MSKREKIPLTAKLPFSILVKNNICPEIIKLLVAIGYILVDVAPSWANDTNVWLTFKLKEEEE